MSRPFLDLKTVAVLMNRGEFKGASLHNMTNKPHGGGNIPQLYDEKKFGEIEDYIKKEADEFFDSRVKERFEEIFAQANPKDLRGLLPKKPPVAWAELPVEIQREIQVMHDNSHAEKITERTLKKRVRQYLIDQFIIDE